MPDAAHGNVAPDAVQRLAGGFLDHHHVEAARRLARVFERARIAQRVTMSYDPARVGASRRARPGDLSDSAADARKRLGQLASSVPGDCWGVLTDVCGFDKGLQQIELERGWPRRSAKLVLRIGLDHLAGQWGLSPLAMGAERAGARAWLPERPPMFASDEVA